MYIHISIAQVDGHPDVRKRARRLRGRGPAQQRGAGQLRRHAVLPDSEKAAKSTRNNIAHNYNNLTSTTTRLRDNIIPRHAVLPDAEPAGARCGRGDGWDIF